MIGCGRARRGWFAGRRVWIVGASSGIGAALASELADRGARVAISARRAERLQQVSAGRMFVRPTDVTDAGGLASAAGQVRAELGGLDTVIFSAGTWQRFDVRRWDRAAFAEHVEINLLGLNNLIAAVLPGLVEQGHGELVGVASLAGYRGLAGAEAYGTTKAAQLYLMEALRAALAGSGVHAVTVSPGFVRTEMTADNDFPMPFLIDADRAARAIADGLAAGRREIAFPLPTAAALRIARLLPAPVWEAISARGAGR